MPVKGSAELTSNLSVAVSPDMKHKVEAAARRQGVKPAVVARWAIEDWLTNNAPAVDLYNSAGGEEQ
jgi:predicted transcriptional regulator